MMRVAWDVPVDRVGSADPAPCRHNRCIRKQERNRVVRARNGNGRHGRPRPRARVKHFRRKGRRAVGERLRKGLPADDEHLAVWEGDAVAERALVLHAWERCYSWVVVDCTLLVAGYQGPNRVSRVGSARKLTSLMRCAFAVAVEPW